MSVTSELSRDGEELTITITGRFDFAAHQDFRGAYEGSEGTPRRFVVDLKDTSYLDSSALGMLLLLRDHAGGENSKISLINCNKDVGTILTISNFSKLFKIA
ncbi:STAS domain-containing protein [Pseudomonas sp. 10B1]|uniref:STAS domain-containing protein n=2 Tax=unclassified Pseudomonas TaxID=196821 RepID=UPI002AB57497|nr:MULTISPECIES: STAS domain-containing protein [unclassified Pseudomonas]MDY7560739.1 STAS domain-containing protein [Pseudomonas sp. AB6]MEA9978141.1 STAS domain-containing protein [Pseudomonas sp. RTS4]MEA9996023.1 STAS domain-containing protein [Pseudomonas sp. AA4]MEB0087346.1 STAS domain-containing protein [Pseudomonas sp. RTI1]MEB0127918.1 STAS domain-containing protein [Pseudomonas sp. CCC1.2]